MTPSSVKTPVGCLSLASMNKAISLLIIAIVALAVLVSAGPTLVALVHSLAPLVLAVGLVVGVLRLVWYWTSL